jgi:hypothetical protein
MLFSGTAPTTFDLCTLGLSFITSVPLSVAVYDIDDAGQIVGFGHETPPALLMRRSSGRQDLATWT